MRPQPEVPPEAPPDGFGLTAGGLVCEHHGMPRDAQTAVGDRRGTALSAAGRWCACGALGLLGSVGVVRGLASSPHESLVTARVVAGSSERHTAETVQAADAGPEAPDTAPSGGGDASGIGASVIRKLDINTATAAELDLLPRIGPTLAARIIADREEHGPFGSLDDLTRVHGIGTKTVAGLVPHATAE